MVVDQLTRTKRRPIESPAVGVMGRKSVSVPFQTGIKAIDGISHLSDVDNVSLLSEIDKQVKLQLLSTQS